MAEGFAAMLRRLRLATTVTLVPDRPHLVGTRWASDGFLSANGLARRARIDPAYVGHLEAGRRRPSASVVERICAALECTETERARLLVAAGLWPWPDEDDATQTVLIALALAVIDGDLRPLEQAAIDASRAMHQNG